jgi:hypothetical protein
MREREGVVRDTVFKAGQDKYFFSLVLKVPRQCPFVLPVEVCLTEGEVLGIVSGCDFIMSRGEEMSRGFTAYDGK